MTPLVRLAAIEKRYGQRVALQLPALEIYPEQLYVLSGPNGSGKSTLLNVLAMLLRPERGQAWFAGEAVTWRAKQVQALRRRITLVHQSPYLFAGTVAGNVGYGLRARHIAGPDAEAAIRRALETVGLSEFADRNIRQLSGGEARRVALARALVLEPQLLLLDEPLANLDEASAAILERLVTALPAQGTTVVMSTHDREQAERMAAQIIRLSDGRLVPSGNPDLGAEASFDKVELCPRTKKQERPSSTVSAPSGLSVWKSLTQWRE